MTIVLHANKASGRGIAGRLQARFRAALGRAGLACVEIDAGAETKSALDAADRPSVLVVFGGDGTIHHAASEAIARGLPIYHVPTGNENLFARAMGTTRRPAQLIEAVRAGQIRHVDVGSWRLESRSGQVVHQRLFTVMASTGLDASIIHRLGSKRSWAVGHMAYAAPIAAEVFSPRPACVAVHVDGQAVVTDMNPAANGNGRENKKKKNRGTLIVASTREYASGMDFARAATPTCGRLHAVFLPHAGAIGAAPWALRARFRQDLAKAGAVVASGTRVEIESTGVWQLDGEAVGDGPQANGQHANGDGACNAPARAICEIQPASLPVLLPVLLPVGPAR